MIRTILRKLKSFMAPKSETPVAGSDPAPIQPRVNLSRRAERLHNRNRKAASQYLTIHEILEGPK
jgi:hypothetical protein